MGETLTVKSWRCMGFLAVGLSITFGCQRTKDPLAEVGEHNLLTFSRIDRARELATGKGATVAILDWQFDLRGDAAEKYINPTSLVPGEPIGQLKPWHGEWMAEIVHEIARGARIMPIKARGMETDSYEEHVIQGIRLAADQGAAAVTSSMGPLRLTDALVSAIESAESLGTIFINVHPEYVIGADGKRRLCGTGECDPRIIHTGVVSVPEHPTAPEPNRDVYVWPYDLQPKYKDGWGYSNGPPIVAGVIALMREADPELTPAETRRIIASTTRDWKGFPVLNAEAAVKAARGH